MSLIKPSILCTTLLSISPIAHADTLASSPWIDNVQVSTRGSGWYQDNRAVKPTFKSSINLRQLKVKVKTLYDSQYRQKRTFKGLPLIDVLHQLPKGPEANTALLGFHNGMKIPVNLKDLYQNPTSLYLATRIKNSAGKWQRTFPRLRKPNFLLKDPRPLTFQGNKLVTNQVNKILGEGYGLNPLRFANSLVSIEFIQLDAYQRQFKVKGAMEGHKVFSQRCQFCHGVRDVGASYGWDFVSPIPLYKKRTPESLLFHVQNQKNHALEHGLMMPQQKDMKAQEAKALWQWMKQVSQKNLKPYRP